jgi:hypothetical protein
MRPIATFNDVTFTYETKTICPIDVDEYVEVYSNIVIVKSNNPKFKIADKIEQISVEIKLHYEHTDGTPY